MRKFILTASLFLSLSSFAQVSLIKLSGAKGSDTGLSYYLPKTVLYVDIEATKTTIKAGKYARYTEKFLGIKNAPQEDITLFSLDNVTMETYGEPDKNEGYMLQYKSNNTPYIYLTKEGTICSVNMEPHESYKSTSSPAMPQNKIMQRFATDNDALLSEEYLMSGSSLKMAEVAAKQIYRIRESRQDILMGEAEHMPKDGEALKFMINQLDEKERALTSMFTGNDQKEKVYFRFKVDVAENAESQILFRFSNFFGVVDKNDLSGDPVYINLKVTDRKEHEPVNPKDKKKTEDPGIMYNNPGRAVVSIRMGKKNLISDEFSFTQFGIKNALPASLFENKKVTTKVLLDMQNGSVRELIQ